jgi:hypothetical protein
MITRREPLTRILRRGNRLSNNEWSRSELIASSGHLALPGWRRIRRGRFIRSSTKSLSRPWRLTNRRAHAAPVSGCLIESRTRLTAGCSTRSPIPCGHRAGQAAADRYRHCPRRSLPRSRLHSSPAFVLLLWRYSFEIWKLIAPGLFEIRTPLSEALRGMSPSSFVAGGYFGCAVVFNWLFVFPAGILHYRCDADRLHQ